MIEALYIIFGIPMIAVCAWLMFGKADQIKWPWALGGLLYGVAYVGVFHFWLRHI